MHENFELLLSRFSGDWVSLLGDDDALMPDALERVVEIVMRNYQCDAVMSRLNVFLGQVYLAFKMVSYQ